MLKLEQFMNADPPIVLTVLGIATVVKLEQP